MNDRIKELRLDAGISRLHDEPYLVAVNKSGEIEDPMIGLEKFAQLIVRECVQLCQECIDDGCVEAQEPMEKIKKHFGVEE